MNEEQARAREAASRVSEAAQRAAGELQELEAEVAAAGARKGELQEQAKTHKVGRKDAGAGAGWGRGE